MFPIVEYRTGLDGVWNKDGSEYECHWGTKMSIDLRWVAAARPHISGGTWVILCGSVYENIIDANYADFMRDWVRAKGLAP